MPTPFDLLSEQLDDETDPDDQLRLALGQDQGGNLAGAPQAKPSGRSARHSAVPAAPAACRRAGRVLQEPLHVAGPLAALARKPGKPHIRLKNTSPPPHVKKIKPKIRLKWPTGGRT